MADDSPQRPARRQPIVRLVMTNAPKPRYAAAAIVIFWLVGTIVFGTLEHLVDEKTFPSIWLGMWWAVQTVTTVGYGDVVPKQTSGRLIAAVLMLGGLSFFGVLTASVTSAFVSRAQQQLREEHPDPTMRRLDELTAMVAELRAEIARRPPGT